MTGEQTTDRAIHIITGKDRIGFLQGLVTSDMGRLTSGLVYTALLTPQGKYLADFFLVPWGTDALLLDIKRDIAAPTLQRLAMYRLRADVQIAPAELHVQRGLGPAPEDGFADPRDPSLGWRRYAPEPGDPPRTDWDAIRVNACVPESGVELIPEKTFILEAGFERMRGVDHRKGCYVGQEVTARMKHKTELRKGLVTLEIDGSAAPGTEILADGKSAGTLYSQADGKAIAYLRFDRATPEMQADQARLRMTGAIPPTGAQVNGNA